jgi:dUTP pyrophosphatase
METGFDANSMQEILKQFEQIKKDAGIEPDEQSQKELEDLLGFSMDDFDVDINRQLKTRTLQVKKLREDAYEPSYNYESDSGFDLHSTEDVTVDALGRALVPTGLRFDIPMGHEIQVRPKSGLALKEGLTVLNTPGTVDAGYDGEVKVIIYNTNPQSYQIKKGQKIAQAVLCPVLNGKFVTLHEVIELNEKERGSNGFGSTGI